MTNTIRQQYAIERAHPDRDRAQILRLWKSIQEPRPDEKKLQWFYLDNPAGHSMAYVLRYIPEDRLVGVILASPRKIRIENKEYTGAVLGDFVVEPRHRSLGPGLLLQNTAVEMTLVDFDLQYGFPNPASERLRRYAGMSIDHQLTELVLPVDVVHYLSQRLPLSLARLIASPVLAAKRQLAHRKRARMRRTFLLTEVDDAFVDQLWASLSEKKINIGVRDSQFVNWRLRDNPFAEYEFWGVRDRDGKPAAYVVIRRQEDRRTEIVDVVTSTSAGLKALLAELVCNEQEEGSRSISVAISDQDGAAIEVAKSLGFHERGKKHAYVDLSSALVSQLRPVQLRLSIVDNDV